MARKTFISTGVGCLLIAILACGFVGYLASKRIPREGAATQPAAEPVRQQATPQRQREIRQAVQALIDTGAVHSVDYDASEVRINPAVWTPMDVDQKKGVVMRFSGWFKELGGTGRVKIRSSKDDSILAEYSIWSGVTVNR